jgi:hypothetical protein
MHVSVGVLLHQNGPGRGERGISHNKKQQGDITPQASSDKFGQLSLKQSPPQEMKKSSINIA